MRRTLVATGIAVLLAFATCLAVLPATANAHVTKKYKTLYSSTLKRWRLYETEFSRTVDLLRTTVTSTVPSMQALIGQTDPASLNALQLLQTTMAAIANGDQNEGLDAAITKLTKESAGFYKRAAPWFATKADKHDLQFGSNQFNLGMQWLALEHTDVRKAAAFLTQTPLDQTMIDAANKALTDAGNDEVASFMPLSHGLRRLESLE